MKKFKNRKYVKNVKNVNNTVKNNANMDGFEELVKAAKEFKGALDDEVANREYERKKLAKAKEIKELMELQEEALRSIGGNTTSGVIILSSEPRGCIMTYDDWYGTKYAESSMQAVEDAINAKIDETNGARKSHEKAFWHKVKKDIINPVTKEEQKLKPASDVESLKAELENLNAHFKGVCAERDNLAACLKSCEKDLKLKQDEAITMRQEAVYQFKRAEKAEAFIKQIDGACDLIKKHIAAYGSKKKSK